MANELTRALDQQWLMAEARPSARTILVVDDDPGIRELVHAMLSIEGFEVRLAASGDAALDVLASAYGSVLSDVTVELPAGLAELTPSRIDPVPAGGESFVFARMTSGVRASGDVVVRGRVGNESFEQRYPLDVSASTIAGNACVSAPRPACRTSSKPC